jgi:hypothetical protein
MGGILVNGEPVPITAGTPMVSRELAEALAESRQLREIIDDILSRFGPSGSGHTARVGQVQIAKWRDLSRKLAT